MARILVINTGSTSTKLAVFEEEQKCTVTLEHSAQSLAGFASPLEQLEMRTRMVTDFLNQNGFAIENFDAVAARGGSFAVFSAGAYFVDQSMIDAIHTAKVTPGAAWLACLIAHRLVEHTEIPAYIYDAVSVDEMDEIAHISGLPEIPRRAAAHTLNSKAVARMVAEQLGSRYEEMNFVVAHLGGGISTTAHCRGRIVDLVADDEGTFSPERAGNLPCSLLVDLCYCGAYTYPQMKKLMRGKGGLVGYLGTNDCTEVERRIAAGDTQAAMVYRAMAYQVSKDIAAMSAALSFEVDRVLLTGGIAYSKYLTDLICRRVAGIAPIEVVPGSFEMMALAAGILRVLRGEETAKSMGDVVLH